MELKIYGEIASNGIADGYAIIIQPFSYYIPHHTIQSNEEREREYQKFQKHLQATIQKISNTQGLISEEFKELLEIQIHFLRDPILLDGIRHKILEEGKNEALAVYESQLELKKFFYEHATSFIQQRWIDFQDAIHLLLEEILNLSYIDISIQKINRYCELECNYILVAKEISPLFFLKIPKPNGIILQQGSLTDHLSILATNYGIPILINVFPYENFIKIQDGDWISINTGKGVAIIYKGVEINSILPEQETKERKSFKPRENITVSLNAEDPHILKKHKTRYQLSIGLFRTEFLYLRSPEIIHSIRDSVNVYKEIFSIFEENEILTLRLIDVNYDKTHIYFYTSPENRNKRGIQYYKSEKKILLNQIQSIYHALNETPDTGWKLRILVPMVASYEDWEFVRDILFTEKERILNRSVANLEFGIMLEIPSVFYSLHLLDNEVDFYSLGTNDLLSCFLGKERINLTEEDSFEPSLYRMLYSNLNHTKKEVSICGTLSTKPELLPVFYYSNIRNFSVPSGDYPKIYSYFENFTIFENQKDHIIHAIMTSSTKNELKTALSHLMNLYYERY